VILTVGFEIRKSTWFLDGFLPFGKSRLWPNAMWIVPKIFSASRNSFISRAFWFMPNANSPAMFDQSSVASHCLTLVRVALSFEVMFSALPFFAVISSGVFSRCGMPPIARSQVSLPFNEFSTGATITSPVGRFIHFRSFQSSLVSVKNGLFSVLKLSFVPVGFVISTLMVLVKLCISLMAKFCIFLCSSVVSAKAPFVSMSNVTPGQWPRRAFLPRVSRVMIFTRNTVSSPMPRMMFM